MTDTNETPCLEEERFQHPWSKLDKGSKVKSFVTVYQNGETYS